MMKSTVGSHEVEVVNEATGRRLNAVVVTAGADIVVVVGGGERPHIGAVVLAQPNGESRSPSCSLLTIPPHKEEAIARPIAERLCAEFGHSVVVSAGVHDDGLDRAGIEDYLELAAALAEKIVAGLRD